MGRLQTGFRDDRESVEDTLQRGFNPKLVKRVIALCHPDRHPPERREECNVVTAELNGPK